MHQSIVGLSRQRDGVGRAAYELVLSRWHVVQEELGVPPELRSADGPARLDLDGGRIGFDVGARVPAADGETERRSVRSVSVPSFIFGLDPAGIRDAMRTELPLVCGTCGIFHRCGTRWCDSPAECRGNVGWRTEAPAPLFYVERKGRYGYFDNPAPRRLRYAIDLRDHSIFGVQITLRDRDRWIDPTAETLSDIISRVAEDLAPELPAAIRGEPTAVADPACLSLDPPDWCHGWRSRRPLEVRHPRGLRVG